MFHVSSRKFNGRKICAIFFSCNVDSNRDSQDPQLLFQEACEIADWFKSFAEDTWSMLLVPRSTWAAPSPDVPGTIGKQSDSLFPFGVLCAILCLLLWEKTREQTWLNAIKRESRLNAVSWTWEAWRETKRGTESGEIHERLLTIYQLIPSTVVSVTSQCASTCNSHRPRWIRLTDYSTKIITGEFTTQYGNIRPSKLTSLHHHSTSFALFR